MSKEELIVLLQKGQQGNNTALRSVIKELGSHQIGRIVKRYKNPDLDMDEVIGVWEREAMLAAFEAKMNIGNPLEFIIWKAHKRTISHIRSFYISHLIVHCLEPKCEVGWQSFKMEKGVPICAKCHSAKVETTRRTDSIEGRGRPGVPANSREIESALSEESTPSTMFDMFTGNIQIAEIRTYLVKRCGSPTASVVQLFDLIVRTNDSSFAIQELARARGVGTTTAWQAMKKLRIRVGEYIAA